MRIHHSHKSLVSRFGRNEEGMAVIVVIALFAIMMLFMGMSLRSLDYLRQDLKIIERQQLQRIQQRSSVTNAVIATNTVLELSVTNSSPLSQRP